MKILITGITGFIGKYLAKYLNSKGHEIFGVDKEEKAVEGAIKVTAADILDKEKMKEVCKEIDVVIHLAAIAFVPDAAEHERLAYDVNVTGTKNLVEAFEESDANKFIFASTSKVYGTPEYLPIDENHPTKPTGPYGSTKLEAEQVIEETAPNSGKQYIILRQFNIYGPGQDRSFLIPSIIEQVKEKEEISLGNTSVKRDYTYIGDLAECYSILLEKDMPSLSLMNVGSGENHSVQEVVDVVSSILGKEVKVNVDENKVRKNDSDEVASVEKVKGLGWEHITEFEEGLRKTVEGK